MMNERKKLIHHDKKKRGNGNLTLPRAKKQIAAMNENINVMSNDK
jgi:hypothetical protein